MSRPASTRGIIGFAAGLVALWWAAVTWGVPLLIRAAHTGRLPLADRLLPGRGRRPLAGYLELWEPIARASVILVLTTALLLIIGLLLRRQGRWRHAHGPEADAPPATARQLLVIAAGAGLLTGLAEAYYYILRLFYLGQETPGVFGLSQHAVWLSPLANLTVFLLIGGAAVGVRRLAGERPSPRAVVTGFAWLGLFAVTMATDRLHWAAAAILTLGLAVRFATILSPGAGEVAGLARRRLAWVVLLVVGLGAAVPVVEILREQRQLSAAGHPPTDVPNVLFIVLDTQRAASTGFHGAARPTTPFLDQLAREGVWFQRALAPSSWTLPSHAAMFTGRDISTLGVNWTVPLSGRHAVLAEALSRRGYATAGFVANNKYLSDVFGLGRGFGVWRDQAILPGTVIVHSWLARTLVEPTRQWLGRYQLLRRKTADRVNREFLAWLDRRDDRPFLAFLNYYDPHMPYLPPAPWNLRFSDTQPLYWVDGERADTTYTTAEKAELLAAYEASIAYLDNQLEALFSELESRKLIEDLLVVVTSDHGEEFGEHGAFEHGFDMTMTLTHVPLVLRLPGTIPAGVSVPDPVALEDVAATILGLTGGTDATIGGASLARHWSAPSDPASREMVFSTDGSISSLVTERFQLLRVRGRKDRLYDHREDPHGLHDLAEDPAFAEALTEHQRLIQVRLDARP